MKMLVRAELDSFEIEEQRNLTRNHFFLITQTNLETTFGQAVAGFLH